MKRRWIVLILIPITAIVTVFAWSIEPVYAIAAAVSVVVLGIVLMILMTRLQGKSEETSKNNYTAPSQASDSQTKERKKTGTRTATGIPLPPAPPLEAQESDSAFSEGWDEAVEEWEEDDTFLEEDLDDEIALPPQQIIPEPEPKVQAPPAPAPGASFGSSDKSDADEEPFEEENSPVRYSGGISLPDTYLEDLGDSVIEEKKKEKPIQSSGENVRRGRADLSDKEAELKRLESLIETFPVQDSKAAKNLREHRDQLRAEIASESVSDGDLPRSVQQHEAQFTAYYARQTIATTEYGFYVYAHLPDALISADIEQFREQLGGRVPKPAHAGQTAELEQGAILTAMVECDALEFTQIGIMKKWQTPFVRFDFRYTAPESLVDEFVEGRIAIMLGMIEIASIDFQTLITAPQWDIQFDPTPHDPMTQTAFEASEPATMYQKIFISYSRKDTVIAEQYRKAQTMAGNIIFMDTHTIRAGEDWEEALKRFIREADVFQLFWSEHSAASDHVKFEWDYALNQRCSETRCIGFIRPAYWEQPLIAPPPELGHLHFAYVPQEGILS